VARGTGARGRARTHSGTRRVAARRARPPHRAGRQSARSVRLQSPGLMPPSAGRPLHGATDRAGSNSRKSSTSSLRPPRSECTLRRASRESRHHGGASLRPGGLPHRDRHGAGIVPVSLTPVSSGSRQADLRRTCRGAAERARAAAPTSDEIPAWGSLKSQSPNQMSPNTRDLRLHLWRAA